MAGLSIGIMFAIGSYRFQYASIWDYHFNHIPLRRLEDDHGYNYHLDRLDMSLCGSRKRRWKDRDIYGAPSDAVGTLTTIRIFL